MLSATNTLLKKRPFMISLVSNTIKTIGADLVTQHIIESKSETDWKRVSVFASFGLMYLGGWQYVLFNKIFPKVEKIMLASKWTSTSKSATLTFLDMGVHTPLMYFPAFYTIKNIADGQGVDNIIKDYKTNIKDDLATIWKLWIPAQMINFTYIPIHLRMPFITGVSFAWTIILSMTRGKQT